MLRNFLILLALQLSNFSFSQSFYVCSDKKNLALANVDDCSYKVICRTSPLLMYDIAFTPDRTLYATDGKAIYRLDPKTCSYTPVIDSIASNFYDLTALVAANDSILIGATADSRLFKISLSHGTSSLIGLLSQAINGQNVYYRSAGDLIFYKGQLYLSTTGNSGLLAIGLDANYHITHLKMIGEMEKTYNKAFGMVTLGVETCTGGNPRIIALAEQYAYLVDPSNTTTRQLCNWGTYNWMVDNLTYGAAYIPEVYEPIETHFELPNVFTPNGDNSNDFFEPVKNEHILENEITIHDRWGKLVYHSNETAFSWDGINLQKEESSEGTYFYTGQAKDACDQTFNYHGMITLFR